MLAKSLIQSHMLNRDDLAKLYPRLQDFLDLRSHVDPDGLFVNDYITRHLLANDRLSFKASSEDVKSKL